MIQIDNTIISFDVFDKHFLCDLEACKGVCCVAGDSGAPLTDEEAILIEEHFPVFEKYLPKKYKKVVEEVGYSVIDMDGDLVTPLFENKECVYTFHDEKGITKCAIEKAWSEGEIDFKKPLSCHLFPIRISKHTSYDALNYEQLSICKAARLCGAKVKLPVYKFLKEPLIRAYGDAWYAELEIASEELKKYRETEL